MKLTFRKLEVKNLKELEVLVTDHIEALEPGLTVIGTDVNLGRATVSVAALDTRLTPILIAAGPVADDTMLFQMLEAYAWCLEYPDSLRQLVPPGSGQPEWPPRVAFVAERHSEAFLRKIRLVKFPRVECFEYRLVEVNGSTGFYVEPLDWTTAQTKGTAAEGIIRPRASDAWLLEAKLAGMKPVEAPAAPAAPAPVLLQPGSRVDPGRGATLSLEALRAEASRATPPRPDAAPPAPAPRPERVREERERPNTLLNGLRRPEERPVSPKWLEMLEKPPAPAGDAVSAAAPAPEAPRPVAPERPVEAPRPVAAEPPRDESREILPVIQLPPVRDLAPTWRKFLDKLTGTFESRPAAAPGAPEPALVIQPLAAPVTPPAGNGTAPATSERHRNLLDGVRLPANGELAPQWRRFLDQPAIDEGKLAAVREYLQREFPMCTVYDFHDVQRAVQVFQLQDNQGKVIHMASVPGDFLEEHHDHELRAWLERHRLAPVMRQAGQSGVLVTPNGTLQIDKR